MHDDTLDTYYGLERIVTSHDELIIYLREAIRRVSAKGFVEKVSKRRHGRDADSHFNRAYQHIFLADTFFTDTWDSNLLMDLFRAAKISASGPPDGQGHPAIPCEILLLNPFSDQARVRTIMLEAEIARKGSAIRPFQKRFLELSDNWGTIERDRKKREQVIDEVLPKALWRTCQGILKICAVLEALRDDKEPSFELPDVTDDSERREYLLYGIKELRGLTKQLGDEKRLDVKVQFTSELMILPFYIIGPHVFKGVLMPRGSSVNKPWSIYRDDPKRNDDTFEITYETFRQAWDSSVNLDNLETDVTGDTEKRTPQGNLKKCILIAYSEANKDALNAVSNRLAKVAENIRPLDFTDASGAGTVTKETIQNLMSEASAGIAIMFPDEEIASYGLKHQTTPRGPVARTRQNVVHELGLMQGRYGWEKVLVICAEGGEIENPTNLKSLNVEKVRLRSDGVIDTDSLDGILRKFITDIKYG